jgi:hypothetical protein
MQRAHFSFESGWFRPVAVSEEKINEDHIIQGPGYDEA